MIKMILEIGHVDYDEFLNKMLEIAKQHPEQMGGMKLPPFSKQMLKMIPAQKKNEMMAQALNGSKDKAIPQAEMMLSRFLGPVRLRDLEMNCGTKNVDEISLMVEFYEYDSRFIIDNILPRYYSEATASQMLGENYAGSKDLYTVQNYMKQQDYKTCQLLIAKSISANRPYIMQMVENGARTAEIEMRLNTIRVMVK